MQLASHGRPIGKKLSHTASEPECALRASTYLATAMVALCLAVGIPAHAGCQGTDFTFCSKTFYATARCDGQDQLASIARNHCSGGPKACPYCESGQDCPLIEAWEPTAIIIVGVEITILGGSNALSYAYAGNGHHPNQMAFLGAGQSHTRSFFPAGTGFRLPPSGTHGYINLHVSCVPTVAAQVQAWYTLYYTVSGSTPREQKD